MNANVLKRGLSFFIDTVFILALVVLLYRVVARPLIENSIPNFDTLYSTFIEAQDARFEEIVSVQEDLDQGLISEEAYTEQLDEIDQAYNENYADETAAYTTFITSSAVYFIGLSTLINYLYQATTGGRTVGRRVAKLRLAGPVNWWTLLVREVFWKSIYWVFTLGFGIFIDFILISLTQQRKTIRDYLTKTKVVVEDTLYPI